MTEQAEFETLKPPLWISFALKTSYQFPLTLDTEPGLHFFYFIFLALGACSCQISEKIKSSCTLWKQQIFSKTGVGATKKINIIWKHVVCQLPSSISFSGTIGVKACQWQLQIKPNKNRLQGTQWGPRIPHDFLPCANHFPYLSARCSILRSGYVSLLGCTLSTPKVRMAG